MNISAELRRQDLETPVAQANPETEKRAVKIIYLHPGQLFVGTEPTAVTTILGSCVAVCLWDSTSSIGGINHYLLPTGLKAAATGLRYGNVAIELLLERLTRAGAFVPNLRAKIFGGACVLEAMRGRENHLGEKNVQIARQMLADAGIPILASDVGGGRGRKLIYHPHEGSVLVKWL